MALIGLLSDSHGRAARTRAAVRLLVDRGVDRIIHLGDVETEEVIEALIAGVGPNGSVRPPVHLVFGNTDWDPLSLGRYAEGLGITVHHPMGRLESDGRTLVFTHGHLERALGEAVESGADYVCHGHTHRRRDERVGRTRLINPGALHRAAEYTAAALDTAADRVRFVRVPR